MSSNSRERATDSNHQNQSSLNAIYTLSCLQSRLAAELDILRNDDGVAVPVEHQVVQIRYENSRRSTVAPGRAPRVLEPVERSARRRCEVDAIDDDLVSSRHAGVRVNDEVLVPVARYWVEHRVEPVDADTHRP